MRNLIVAAIVGLSVSACAGIQEHALAPNMVRLDINAPTAPFANEAMLRRAAELTLSNGYGAFRLVPIYELAFDSLGVTVVMFHAGDPQAEGAFDAANVLKKTWYGHSSASPLDRRLLLEEQAAAYRYFLENPTSAVLFSFLPSPPPPGRAAGGHARAVNLTPEPELPEGRGACQADRCV
jgi:hypothetical protein